jgi:chemotaxis response regulator CheB
MWTAFILYTHPLFARGLESLLTPADGVVVTGLEPIGEKAFALVEPLRPDVIFIESDRGVPQPENFLSVWMKKHPETVIVSLNLQDTTAIIYYGRRCTADSAEDLLECVLGSLTARTDLRRRGKASPCRS